MGLGSVNPPLRQTKPVGKENQRPLTGNGLIQLAHRSRGRVSWIGKHFRALLHRYDIRKVRWIVEGGETGQASRHKVLQAVANECADDSVVLLHDGVRPLINHQLITENIEAVRTHGSAITCTKFNETVTVVHDDAITEVIPRDHIYAAQAPQSFRLGEILALYDRAVADGEHDSIDSCTLMKRYDHPLHAIEGPRSNIKVTTAEDFYVCRTFFQLLEDQQIAGL